MESHASRHIFSKQAEIDEYLRLLEQDAEYRLLSILGESAVEITQLVRFRGRLFVRKLIRDDSGIGEAYRHLMALQRSGGGLGGVPRIESCHLISKAVNSDDPAGVPAGTWQCVVMEYVEGETVSEAVVRRGASIALAAEVIPSVCDAVSGLHRADGAPIIHRDLKPDNIIISSHGAVLIDFGISRIYKEGNDRDTAMFGTRAYAPPEQFGFGQTDCRSDVYALGMLLYFCLTGEDPAPGLQRESFSSAGCPEQICRVMSRACSLDPDARYPSVEELKAALLAACEGLVPKVRSDVQPSEAGVQGSDGAGDCAMADSSADQPPSSKSILSRVPRRVGMVWNIGLLAVWVFFLVSSIASACTPADQAQVPLAVRLLENVGTGLGFLTVCAFALMDRRALYRFIPRLREVSVPSSVLMAFGAWSLFVFALSMFEAAAGFV